MSPVKKQMPLYANRNGIWEDKYFNTSSLLKVFEPPKTYLSPVMVIVNPSYSFPWSLRLGTFVFTVNPSLVLLLNCFQKKKKSNIRVNAKRQPASIVLKHLQLEKKWKWTSWVSSAKSYCQLHYFIHSSFATGWKS